MNGTVVKMTLDMGLHPAPEYQIWEDATELLAGNQEVQCPLSTTRVGILVGV